MKTTARLVAIVALMAGLRYTAAAQLRTPSAAWLLPGISWHPSENTRLLGQAGYNHYLRAALIYPQAFIFVHKNIVLNPGYIFFVQKKDGSPRLSEHYLMNSIILRASCKSFFAEDRNMIWNRITVGSHARHYYRNRLKVGNSFKLLKISTKLYVYDEVYYLFNNKLVTRNRVASGISCDLSKHINTEITYLRQWDRYSGNLNLFFIVGTWQW